MKVDIGPYPDGDEDHEIDVHIDNYDTWSMDYTLAHIIVPMLKQLKETKHGAPYVKNEDRPAHLIPTEEQTPECETDEFHFEAWDWVMDEMIFAFESKLDDSWEDQFTSGVFDKQSVPCDVEGNVLPEDTPEDDIQYYTFVDGPNHTYEINWDARNAYQARISNGFRLFGVYYEGLWD